MSRLVKVLMHQDGITEEEANEVVSEMREEMNEYIAEGDMESAFYVCENYGLEPDYLEDLIF